MARDDHLPAVRGTLTPTSRLALRALFFAALASAASSVACDPQVDSDYRGEPLVTLRGQVAGEPPLPPLEAAILWQRGPPPSMDDQELATRAPVESGFPATFTIRLYQPPPPAARRALAPGEVSFARGNAAAVPFEISPDLVPSLPASSNPWYGVDVDHWLLHLAADVPSSSLTAWWLGAALPAGYHLMRVTSIDPASIGPAELEACVGTLIVLGVPDDGTQDPGTARGFCLAPYRLAPAPANELIVLHLGVSGPSVPGSGP